MTTEDIKLIAPLVGVMAFVFGLYQYWRGKPRYKFHIFESVETNTDECGTFLCAQVHISNIGGKPGAFNGFIAIDSKGDEYYPSSTFVVGEEIKPETTISGVIPVGHLISYPPKRMYMQDGVFRKIKIPSRMLKKAIKGLQAEKQRYEEHGWNVHPTCEIKKNA